METEAKDQSQDQIKALIEHRLKVMKMAPELLEGLRHAVSTLLTHSRVMGFKFHGEQYLVDLIARADEGDPVVAQASSVVMPGTPGTN